MRVLQVVPSIDDPSAGTTYAVNRLCESLLLRGVEPELHVLAPLPDAAARYRRVAHRRWRVAHSFGLSSSMRAALRQAATEADIVHNNGLWMMPNILAGAAARAAGRPMVYSVHGMLAPWALSRSRWKKLLVSRSGQDAALATTACFHATATSEYEEIRCAGYSQPVAIVPYGIDIPEPFVPVRSAPRRLLFLSRVHPKKGVAALVEAWRTVQAAFPDWTVDVCGPDNDGYLVEMQQLARRLGAERLRFLGPRYGVEKERLLDACDLFVLPTLNENFGFVVAEALSHARPVIVTRAAPWSGIDQHRCGWWIETGPEALASCLREALAADPGALADMGGRGRAWMLQEFSWTRVAEMMDLTYQWLLGRTVRPAWIRED